jgi:hypothetical protein
MENSKVLEVLSRSLMRIFVLSTTLLFLLSQLADKIFQMHRLCLPPRRLQNQDAFLLQANEDGHAGRFTVSGFPLPLKVA